MQNELPSGERVVNYTLGNSATWFILNVCTLQNLHRALHELYHRTVY